MEENERQRIRSILALRLNQGKEAYQQELREESELLQVLGSSRRKGNQSQSSLLSQIS